MSKVDEVVDHIELNCWEREGTIPNVSFDFLFMKQRHTSTFPILSLVKTGATCCERKGTTAYSISFLVGIIKDLGFRRILLK